MELFRDHVNTYVVEADYAVSSLTPRSLSSARKLWGRAEATDKPATLLLLDYELDHSIRRYLG
jgi:hypothetical protein